MKKILVLAIVAALFGMVSTSCLKRVSQDTNSLSNTTDSIPFGIYKDSITYHIMDDPKRPSYNISVDIQYPYPEDTTENAIKANRYFIKNVLGEYYTDFYPQNAIKNYINCSINEYKIDIEAQVAKNPKAPSENWMNYETIISTNNVYNQKGIWSYTCSSYIYTGGAHGLNTTTCFVYDIYENTPINLSDIFAADSLGKILDMIKSDISKKEYSDVYWMDQVTVSENFIADVNGITWYYNPYEIAPYYVGITTVTLPYKSISEYILKESQIRSIFK